MKVLFGKQVSNAKQEDKNCVRVYSVVGVLGGRLKEVVTLRYWVGKSGKPRVTACIWIYGDNFYTSGKATARGWGDHLYSKVLNGLVESANIEVQHDDGSEYWDFGRGDTEIDEFLKAIAIELGCSSHIIVRHG